MSKRLLGITGFSKCEVEAIVTISKRLLVGIIKSEIPHIEMKQEQVDCLKSACEKILHVINNNHHGNN